MEKLRFQNLRIEEAGATDASKLETLLQRDEQAFHPDFSIADFVEYSQKDFAEVAQDRRKIWFAYADEAGPDPIGMVQLVFHEDSTMAEMHFLYVASQYRGQGVSTALNNRLEKEAKARQIHHLILAVDQKNAYAIAIYERWGYQPLQMNVETENVLMMIKTLAR